MVVIEKRETDHTFAAVRGDCEGEVRLEKDKEDDDDDDDLVLR